MQASNDHINRALQSDPTSQDAQELAARFAVGQRQWQAVLTHLNKMELKKRPDLMLMKATALQFSGQEDAAVASAKQMETALREMAKSATAIGPEVRFSIAMSLSLQRRFEEALKLLEQGIQISPESQDLIMAFLGDCEELTTGAADRQKYATSWA